VAGGTKPVWRGHGTPVPPLTTGLETCMLIQTQITSTPSRRTWLQATTMPAASWITLHFIHVSPTRTHAQGAPMFPCTHTVPSSRPSSHQLFLANHHPFVLFLLVLDSGASRVHDAIVPCKHYIVPRENPPPEMRPFSKFFEQFCICNDASNSVEYIILQQRTCEYKLSTRWRETIRDTHTSADDDVTRESRV